MTLESGKLARQAEGSVVVFCLRRRYRCRPPPPRVRLRPVDVEADVRGREDPQRLLPPRGPPSETAVAGSSLTDRPLRPSFKDGYRDEVQVVITVLSADMANPYDIPGMNAASLATSLAGCPVRGPVGSVRMGLIGGEWVVNPTFQEVEEATFDIVVMVATTTRAASASS